MRWVFAACLTVLSASALADTYSCVDSRGRPHVADRPNPECSDVRQKIMRPDGSVKGYLEPSLSPQEVEKLEQCRAEEVSIKDKQREARLRDRNLLVRFPNEAAHAKARAAALDSVRSSIDQSEKRLAELAKERKPLSDDAEFYKGRQMPARLKGSLDANDAATAAQHQSIAGQQAEMVRINANYDAELVKLKQLWSGAQTGSMDAVAPLSATCVRLLAR
jgi:hypothetical protein